MILINSKHQTTVFQAMGPLIRLATQLAVALAVLAAHKPVHAKDYQVEVLVFENLTPSQATESHDYVPLQSMRSGSEVWHLKPSMLLEEADAVKKSDDYRLLHHYAWGQTSLPYSESATYTLAESDIKGYLKVYADQLLFVNVDIDFKGYRMKENRRLKLNERHFFDHPKFGLLLRVSRLESQTQEEEDSGSAPEKSKADAPDDDTISNEVSLESSK